MRLLKLTVSVTAVFLFGWSGTAVASADEKCSDFKGTLDAALNCQIQVETDTYKMNITFPTSFPGQKDVTDYITQTRDGFKNVAQNPGDREHELDVTATEYNSAVPPRGTQSVVFKTFQDVGGPHPQTFYKSFNYDQGYRKPIPFEKLFAASATPLPVIFPIVAADLQKQLGLTDPIPSSSGLDPANYQNFAITNDAVIFFFSQGTLLPEAAGAAQVSVPRAVVEPMLA